ncbi:hypothetical protein PM10SUCC1_06940 [Propionigenium maris DSM 9537]|uniref:Outer membrane protein TolC n=1 Tax=Propionigenium maris DSM 9537 TaxID=1123000 RepID=A0A9W6GH73_9FUSO|nr:TolC family protein [Propionigenium maris]GLI55179.1 hypothetical protein PM10SUCC1_06940 [Propionigenium maris DSM 9537]
MKRSYWFIYLLISLNLFGKTITLEEAVELASHQNLDIQEKVFEEKIQEKRAYSKKKDLLPKLSATTTLEDSEGSGNKSSETDLLFRGTLYNGGKIINSINLEEKRHEVSTLAKDIDKKNIEFLIKKSYLECLKAIDRRNIVLKSLEFYEKSYEKNKELKELNLITRADLLAVKSELSKRRLDLIQAENTIESLKISLKKLMGLTDEDTLELVSIEGVNYLAEEPAAPEILKENMEINLSNIEVEIAGLEKKISLGNFAPEVTYHMGFNETQDSFSDTYSDFQGIASISFKLDIFSWGQRIDEVTIAQMEVDRKKISQKNSVDLQNERLNLLKNDLNSLEEGVAQSKTALENFQEKFKYYEESYVHKLISLDEYLDSEQDLLDERSRFIGLNYDYKIKKEEILTLLK